MDKRKLWHTFEQSGRVEDYLRYRGITIAEASNIVGEAKGAYGEQTKTTSDDRRPHRTGL